jgi:hypothetical protein
LERSRALRVIAVTAILLTLAGSAESVGARAATRSATATRPAPDARSVPDARPAGPDQTAPDPVRSVRFPEQRALSWLPTPAVALPDYLAPVVDPSFGTTITRVSDLTAMGVAPGDDGSVRYLRNAYAKKQAWNSTGTLLLLQMSVPAPLLDGNTYRFLRMVTPPANATWSNTDPNQIFGVRARTGDFVSYDVRTDTSRVEAHFDGYQKISLGDGEGNLSDDDRWVALHGTTADGHHDVILFDRATGGRWVRRLAAEPNWIGMSHSGDYVVVSYDQAGSGPDRGTVVLGRDLGYARTIDRRISHGDLAYDTTGREVYVAGNDCSVDAPLEARCTGSAALSAFPLDGSRAFPVIAGSTGYNPHGEHVSGRALARPGWVVVSDYGAPGGGDYPGRDQAFAVRVDPAGDPARPVTEPFAMLHHRSDLGYRYAPMASVDQTGTRVIWGSDWNLGAAGPVYAYIAEAPS